MSECYESALNHVNPYSKPSQLRITDIRLATVAGAPWPWTLIKVHTNQGITGFGEVREGASRRYALMLKSRLLGENPCNVDKLFRRIKQFGNHSRQAGGISGIEVALWDLAGKAYGVPVYQMLGGKFRDRVRLYCDTSVEGKHSGAEMGQALRKRLEQGFTFLKMDFGTDVLQDEPGALNAPSDSLEQGRVLKTNAMGAAYLDDVGARLARNRHYDFINTAHPFTGVHFSEKGLGYLDQYVSEVREVIGPTVPLAVDHIGHVSLSDCIRLLRRLERHCPAWVEDCLPWQYTEQYVRLSQSTAAPLCTGEDIYLKEGFRPLLESGALAVVHPDLLSAGGIAEMRKIGDLAQECGVALAMHSAAGPVACLAAVHTAAAMENFVALEYHASEAPWWQDLVHTPQPIIEKGFVPVPDRPGLGIEELNDDVILEHKLAGQPEPWAPTDEWDDDRSLDRWWS